MHCLPGISTKCSAVPQEVSTQVGWTSNVSQCYVSTSSCSAYSSLIIGFSPASYISTLCTHSLIFSQKLRCMEQFVCLALSSLVLFPPNPNQVSLPKLNSLSHLCKTAVLCLDTPLCARTQLLLPGRRSCLMITLPNV